jgi:hypothetical protein
MKSMRIGLLSLACVSGAVAFGMIANATIDLVMPIRSQATGEAVAAPQQSAAEAVMVAEEVPLAATSGFALASATSTPVDLGPVKVKTVPMVYREAVREPAAEPAPVRARAQAIPMPRPRPAMASTPESVGSIPGQSAAMAIAAATKSTPSTDEVDPLSPAGIDRIKTALALTSEQETYWPAVAAELKAIAKTQPHKRGVKKGQAAKIDVDPDTAQRLYWAAAPLITRLSYDQKKAVKQIALSMGLQEVAEAL